MKLVEILARELADWPERATGAQQREHMVIFYDDGCGVGCAKFSEAATDQDTAVVTRAMWEAERAKMEGKTEWNGEGLPPAGADIEYLGHMDKWKKGKYLGEFNGQGVCGDYETGAVGYVADIRPIRTPEQIAAQERELALDEIYRIIRTVDRPGNKADMAEALYAAGYRKQEQSE